MSLPIPGHCYRNPVNWLAWGLGSGLSPRMPGTFGTLVGVGVYLCLPTLSLIHYLLLVSALFAAGVWICGRAAGNLGVHDHASIVWDEIVGYLVAMLAAPPGWVWVVAGFVLFRLFDIWKPWPIHWLDRHIHGGIGIMLDDLLAAIYAVILLQITFIFIAT